MSLFSLETYYFSFFHQPDQAIFGNILVFSICSFLLEASKRGLASASLQKVLQESIDCDHRNHKNFNLLANYLILTLPKISHNLSQLSLDSTPKFRDLKWSQQIEMKNSTGSTGSREKSYILDFHVAPKPNGPPSPSQTEVFSMQVSQMGLQDMIYTLKDCLKNVQSYHKTEL